MWIVQTVVILPCFTIVRLARAVVIRVKKTVKNSSEGSRK